MRGALGFGAVTAAASVSAHRNSVTGAISTAPSLTIFEGTSALIFHQKDQSVIKKQPNEPLAPYARFVPG
jgi:hypothetical protein